MPAQPDTTVDRSAHRDPGRRWVVAAVVLSTTTSLALAFLPTYTMVDAAGETDQQSVIEHEGWDVAAILAIPVLICVAPWLVPARHRRWVTIVAAVLFAACVLVSAASVGLFYLPSAALLVVAAFRTRRPTAKPDRQS